MLDVLYLGMRGGVLVFGAVLAGNASFLLGLVSKQPMTVKGILRARDPLSQAAIVLVVRFRVKHNIHVGIHVIFVTFLQFCFFQWVAWTDHPIIL